MAFTDLPENFRDVPLTEQQFVADVLDLLISERDRRRGCVLFVLCDDAARVMQPCIVDEIPVTQSMDDVVHMAGVFVTALSQQDRMGCVLAAVARQDGLSITEQDRIWREGIERACDGRVRLLGVHVVTLSGSREIPGRAAA